MKIPNIITGARVIVQMASLPLIIYRVVPLWVVLAIYIFNIGLDKLDGILARKLHQESDFGRYWDIAVDRFIQISMLMVLGSMINGFSYLGLSMIMARDFLLTGVRQFCAYKNIFLKGSVWGKTKAGVEMVAIFYAFGYLLWPGMIPENMAGRILSTLMYVTVFFGFLSFYFYYKNNRKVFEENW